MSRFLPTHIEAIGISSLVHDRYMVYVVRSHLSRTICTYHMEWCVFVLSLSPLAAEYVNPRGGLWLARLGSPAGQHPSDRSAGLGAGAL